MVLTVAVFVEDFEMALGSAEQYKERGQRSNMEGLDSDRNRQMMEVKRWRTRDPLGGCLTQDYK